MQPKTPSRGQAGPHCQNVSTTPLRQWGFRQCLPFSWTTLRGKHCWLPIAIMGVVDTFGHCPYKARETCDLSVIKWPLNTSIPQAAVANRANAKWTQSILDPNLNVACTKVSFSGKWLMDWQSYRNCSMPTDANPRETESIWYIPKSCLTLHSNLNITL